MILEDEEWDVTYSSASYTSGAKKTIAEISPEISLSIRNYADDNRGGTNPLRPEE